MDADTIKNSLPGQIRVGGKLDFDVVDKYIREVRGTSGNNRISIMSLYGKSADDEAGYIESMFWLTQKNKIGVVNNFMGSLKDVYLIPLHGEFDLLWILTDSFWIWFDLSLAIVLLS